MFGILETYSLSFKGLSILLIFSSADIRTYWEVSSIEILFKAFLSEILSIAAARIS